VITQAFVLGAGLGTRLRPLTDDLPKPLVPIFQKPLITFAFDHLLAAGCENLVVNMHRLPERFADAFPESLYRGRRILFLHEPEILGTGGGIKNAQRFLGSESFVVYSGDILTDFDLAPLLEEHARAGNDVTLALRKTHYPPTIALQAGRVVDIGGNYEAAAKYDFANVSVWNPQIISRIPSGSSVSFIPTLVEAVKKGERIGGVVVNDGKWFNIGSAIEYLGVHRMICEERWKPSHLDTTQEWPVRRAPSAVVDSTATLSGFYSLGPNCRIEKGVKLRDTIVWPGAQIASKTVLENCIVRTHRTAEGTLRDAII
jgi:NDP-sugar pyrophosphorylase family protein